MRTRFWARASTTPECVIPYNIESLAAALESKRPSYFTEKYWFILTNTELDRIFNTL